MIQPLKVEYGESARTDPADIFRHIVNAGGSPDDALKLTLRIEGRCQSIGDAPRGGRSRDDIVQGLRTVPFEHSAIIEFISSGPACCLRQQFGAGTS
ncbi:MAG: type II toxin-antitoxin system RelE/ParE family toxin [Mesorhizobium sp.]|jgi:toxin ParE1/3/4|uniref:type II toxin-antitoxin system RelE/ParE family toxin n=1 Tax=Mesorhizobium sp. TaxID=1871066 RepID=UPI000FE912FE|nr:type II toxin-antitoxin system RelE/ParE family toxin [Mesorhizobium sp.]RWB06674.1 MAG: type II toxin-antitoxin system RelE/ParE family toxin [Mesorhizobium sp.]RWB13901.1 MAG: type II toxin-antitoxin system RelE/ParE family toxin [Mesorhizobium sp.]RWP74907.1 MAG: type II toxin-antitoxin system RelE/ParE family toxin [Mesorhizobium sp.]RWQ19658.1 MAG: type II toxin-antitoxin system RelE/ParE family toxin [Mesorhizobium sp.]TIN68728.1 MAG: type II toxin-antitoxin system RelE/ParE family to